SENFTSTNNGTEIAFETTPNGTSSRTERMRIANDGKVGIGTTTPTKGLLEVNGFTGAYTLPASNHGFNAASTSLVTFAPGNYASSIFASSDIVTGSSFIAASDARIKRIEGHSDAARDLVTLRGIEVTDYTYIDII